MVQISRNGLLWNVGRVVLTVVLVAGLSALAFLGFIWYPATLTSLLGVLLFAVAVVVSLKLAPKIRDSMLPTHNVAEVPIVAALNYPGGMPSLSFGDGGDGRTIIERIERAERDSNVDALVVRLNTTGGELAPSEDILAAVEEFDGPTFAYVDDWCASAGYWIAIGCDEIWSHHGSMVGSIGVQFSQVRATGLADTLGLQYEDISSGKYKNALGGTVPIMKMKDHERELLQGISDGLYDQFVEKVAERRNLDEPAIRDTGGAFYRGERALELDLIDGVATRQEFERTLERKLDLEEIDIKQYDSSGGVLSVLGGGANASLGVFGARIVMALADKLGMGSNPR